MLFVEILPQTLAEQIDRYFYEVVDATNDTLGETDTLVPFGTVCCHSRIINKILLWTSSKTLLPSTATVVVFELCIILGISNNANCAVCRLEFS